MQDQKRILVVDHSDQRRDYLKQLLEQHQIETVEAASCEEAMNLLGRETVDLILTETELPSMSGLFLLRQVKELLPELEVILITHNASSYNVLQALRNGAYDFIVRPIDTGEILFNAVDRAFSHCQLRRQNTRLLHELEQHNRRLQHNLKMMKALNASIERVSAALDIEELFSELLAAATEEIQADRGLLALFDRSGRTLALKVGQGIPPGHCRTYAAGIPPGLITEMAKGGKPVLVPHGLPDQMAPLAAPGELDDLLTLPGLLASPLRLKQRVVGIVVLSGHRPGSAFGETELHFLIQLSHHAALALEKAGIIHQLRKGRSAAPSQRRAQDA